MATPIALLLGAVVLEIELLGAALRAVLTDDGQRPNLLGTIYVAGGLLLLPVALVIVLAPMVRRQDDGKRRPYALGLAVALFIGVLIALTWGNLAVEVVRCDVMGAANCD